MADAKVAFIAFCNANAEIFGTFGNRITADRIPDAQPLPNARIMQVSSPQGYLMGKGKSGRKVKLQVDVYAADPASADSSAALIENALSGYKGMLGELDAGFVFVRNINGDWNAAARDTHRILELEIGTND